MRKTTRVHTSNLLEESALTNLEFLQRLNPKTRQCELVVAEIRNSRAVGTDLDGLR